jgi:shikimate kinase
MERACQILLIGMMGSGKSTVGRALAGRTGWSYVDNDELLDRLVGATPKEILERDREPALRASESAALRLGLETPAPSIIGVAAGTILDASNREALAEHGIVVWLRARPSTLEARSRGSAHRAWLGDGGAAWIRESAATRDPLDVDERSADDVAAEVHRRACESGAACPCE